MLVGVFRDGEVEGDRIVVGCPHARGGVPFSGVKETQSRPGCPHARGGVPPQSASVRVNGFSLSPCSWGCSVACERV